MRTSLSHCHFLVTDFFFRARTSGTGAGLMEFASLYLNPMQRCVVKYPLGTECLGLLSVSFQQDDYYDSRIRSTVSSEKRKLKEISS